MKKKNGKLYEAIAATKVPIVILDNKWHKIFSTIEKTDSISAKEERLSELLKLQGSLNTESRNIRLLKKKLMNEIVSSIDDVSKVEDNGRLIEDCNRKLEEMQDQLLDVPEEIDRVNKELMLETCELVYNLIHENEDDIKAITGWVDNIRIELKTNLVRRQEMEIQNAVMYSYMHDVFGMASMDIFDLEESPITRLEKIKTARQESEAAREKTDKEKDKA